MWYCMVPARPGTMDIPYMVRAIVHHCPTRKAWRMDTHRKLAGRGHGEKGVFGGAARSSSDVAAQGDRSVILKLALKGWRG